MIRYVVLIRGINVGSTRKLPMAELRAKLTETGFEEVATYIQSGNVALSSDLDAAAVAATVERVIDRDFGLSVPVAVRTAAEWARYAAGSPLAEAQRDRPRALHLCVAATAISPAAAATLSARAGAGETIVADGDVLWCDFREGVGTSKLTPALFDRAAGTPVTARNWNTVQAIAAMLG